MADTFGQRVAKARKDRGMTQAQLAERLHVKQSMVSMIETDEAEYSDELRKVIKQWLDSGAGATAKPTRGPYKVQQRSTLPDK